MLHDRLKKYEQRFEKQLWKTNSVVAYSTSFNFSKTLFESACSLLSTLIDFA